MDIGLAEIGIVIYVILWIIALVDIMRNRFERWYYQLMWLFIIFLMPFGAVAYFIFGGRRKWLKQG